MTTSEASGTGAGVGVEAFDAWERRAWDGKAEAYAASFAHLCAHAAPALLDAAGVPELQVAAGVAEGGAGAGVRLLDVGTGPGTVARLAVARGARVTAVDAEPSMVARAAAAVPQAAVSQALLPQLPFPDGEFDAAVANFVINHVGRPRQAVAELRRVVRSGGRVAVTLWPDPPSPGHALLGRAAEAAGVRRPPEVPTVAPEHDFPRTEEGLTALLAAAGLPGATCRTLAFDHVVDPDVWWSGPASGIAALGQTLARQTAEVVAEVRRHYDALAGEFRRPGDTVLTLPYTALLATVRVR